MDNRILQSRILVTGGAGFIGSHLVEALVKHLPSQVIILDNLSRGSEENLGSLLYNPCVQLVKGDIRDTALLESLICSTDYVFHLAAIRINACAQDPEEGYSVMVNATFRLIQLCVKYGVKKVVFSSSASIYGLAEHFPTPETDPPYDNQTFYGAAKLWGEQLLRSYQHMHGLDFVALRYFNVYGPRMDMEGKYTEVLIKWLDCIRDGRAPFIHGDGSTTMDLVNVKDVVRANIAALVFSASGEVFNIGSGQEVSVKELLHELLKVTGASLQPQHLPSNSINPVSRRLANISKAEGLLDFKPSINLEDGLAELTTWYYEKQVKEVAVL